MTPRSKTDPETRGGFGPPADTYGIKEDAPSVPSSFEQAKARNNERNHGDNYGLNKDPQKSSEKPPHLKKEVNKTMLGDPVSLTSETSDTEMDKDVEEGIGGGKSKL